MTRYTISALVLTAIWIGGAVWHVSANVEWEKFLSLRANELGDFFAGFAAPLAFFWFVAGYFNQTLELSLQRRELSAQRKETKRLAEEASKQSVLIEKNERHAAIGAFSNSYAILYLEIRDLSILILRRLGSANYDESAKANLEMGMNSAYFIQILRYIKNTLKKNNINGPEKLLESIKSKPEVIDYMIIYCKKFSKILELARYADESGELSELIENSPSGNCNRLFKIVVAEITGGTRGSEFFSDEFVTDELLYA